MSVRYGWCLSSILLYVLLACAAHSAPVVLDARQSDYSLGTSLAWLHDAGLNQSVEDVIAAPEMHWEKSRSDIPNLGYSDDAVWFRVQLQNASPFEHWYLVINYPLIRNLDVFVVQEKRVVGAFQAGDRFAFSARPLLHRDFVFPLVLSQAEPVQILVRMSGPYAIQLPLRLKTEYEMLQDEVRASMLHGLFFGFVAVMSLYNFFVYWTTRESSYFYYFLFSVSIGFFQAIQQGVAFQFLWPDEIAWQNKSTGIFIHLTLLSSFLFVSNFLELKRYLPLLYRAFLIVGLLALTCLLASPFAYEFYVMRMGVILAVPACVIAIVGGWLAWRGGRPDAKIFSIAWAIFLLGSLGLALNKLGVLPRTFLTEHGAEIGTVVELALLAFALGGRINHERRQRFRLELKARELERAALVAKEHALELEQMNSEQLERSVRERTEDLHKALADLSSMNRKLESLNMQDPVTCVGNENCFLQALKQEWERAFRAGETLSLMVVELDGYRDLVADHGQVVAEECLKNVAGVLVRTAGRPADVIARYGDKVFGVVLPNTNAEGVLHLARRLAIQLGETSFDLGDYHLLNSVSVGITSQRPSCVGGHLSLLQAAESAVYVAQNNGGNQIQVAGMSAEAVVS